MNWVKSLDLESKYVGLNPDSITNWIEARSACFPIYTMGLIIVPTLQMRSQRVKTSIVPGIQ